MKRALALSALVLLLDVSNSIAAELPDTDSAVATSSSSPGKEASPAPPLIPYRRDTVGGHFQLALTGAYAIPFGSVSQGTAQTSRVGSGASGHVDIGYGLDRHVMIAGYYEQQFYGASKKNCPPCSGTSIGAGALVRYHIVQGLTVDPWISYGVGYRSLRSDSGETSLDYQGLEWLRIGLGTDWYIQRNFGFGPMMQFGAGTMFKRPDGEKIGGTNWRFQFGLRLVLDVPGK